MEWDSLYLGHFLKIVYKSAAKIMVVWIKLRKLKNLDIFKKYGRIVKVLYLISSLLGRDRME